MEYSIQKSSLETLRTPCIVVGVYESNILTPSATHLDQNLNGLISSTLARGDMQGKINESVLINYLPGSEIEQILLIGLGKKQNLSAKRYRKAIQCVISRLKSTKITQAICTLAEVEVSNFDWDWKSRQIVEVINQACYQYKESKSKQIKLNSVYINVPEDAFELATLGLKQGKAIADAVSLTRKLSDLPGNICTPSYLAEQAQTLAQSSPKLTVEVLEEDDMQELGMGALLSVSRGSRQPAKLIAFQYNGAGDASKPIVLVGKGLTFDAGGISLKPSAGMDEMKYDMCGGATVFGAISAAVGMDLPLNIVGLIPSSENMPDGDANKPGDVVTSMAGKTIEILNTDAEGRLILCDTLTYAKKFDPEVVIDMATLTGACIIALGRQPSGLLGNNDDLCNDLIAASETACDSVWRLPIWEEYQDQLKSNFADMANIGGRDAGTITAACFLSRFTEEYRWAHLDIAGTAWRTGSNKGATGRPVPLLCQYLLNQVKH